MSQTDLAGKVGISQRSLSLIETGKCNPNWDTVAALGRELGVAVGDVLEHLVQSQAKGRTADSRKSGRSIADLDMRISAAAVAKHHNSHGKSDGRQCRYCGHLVRSKQNGSAGRAKPTGGSS